MTFPLFASGTGSQILDPQLTTLAYKFYVLISPRFHLFSYIGFPFAYISLLFRLIFINLKSSYVTLKIIVVGYKNGIIVTPVSMLLVLIRFEWQQKPKY